MYRIDIDGLHLWAWGGEIQAAGSACRNFLELQGGLMFHVFALDFKSFNTVPLLRGFVLAAMVSVGTIWAQPDPPNTPDVPCGPTPTGAALEETAGGTPDAEGFVKIFDGTEKGWWQSCQTGHSNGSPLGAVFKFTTVDGEPAIYSNDRNNNIGGILMTKKKYANYELIFDYWPDFGNDGGVFNRTPANGRCFQTVLDYIGDGSVGGTWGEGGFTSRDIRPWKYVGNENTISIPSGNNSWTYITSRNNPESYGCAATGCVAADYLRLWDRNGWNQIRIKFYGGAASGEGPIHMKSWFRKVGSTAWVPIIADTTLNQVVPPNFIGFQVHNGNRFQGEKGTWYKNIRIRELNYSGEPPVSIAARKRPEAGFAFEVKAIGNTLSGFVDSDYEISVQEVSGKTLESFRGRAGNFSHAFTTDSYGWLIVKVKAAAGVESTRILRAHD